MAPPEKDNELKLGTVTTAGESLVPHMIAQYLKKYPDMKVSLYLGEADTLLTWLQEGRCLLYTSGSADLPRSLYKKHLPLQNPD